MASYGFHSEAAEEYLAAMQYYLEQASPLVPAAFVAEVEAAIQVLLTAPERWAITEEPHIRRCLLTRFPYSIYYRWEQVQDRVSIYAVMHSSRRPGYWRERLSSKNI
ncbi:MAG: type II toxin-antitoxin system RelE/ParE family toxin [Pyrinomonadaceae bacterium]